MAKVHSSIGTANVEEAGVGYAGMARPGFAPLPGPTSRANVPPMVQGSESLPKSALGYTPDRPLEAASSRILDAATASACQRIYKAASAHDNRPAVFLEVLLSLPPETADAVVSGWASFVESLPGKEQRSTRRPSALELTRDKMGIPEKPPTWGASDISLLRFIKRRIGLGWEAECKLALGQAGAGKGSFEEQRAEARYRMLRQACGSDFLTDDNERLGQAAVWSLSYKGLRALEECYQAHGASLEKDLHQIGAGVGIKVEEVRYSEWVAARELVSSQSRAESRAARLASVKPLGGGVYIFPHRYYQQTLNEFLELPENRNLRPVKAWEEYVTNDRGNKSPIAVTVIFEGEPLK